MTDPNLPPIYQGVLDDAQLDALLDDIGGCAGQVAIRAKSMERQIVPESDLTLNDVRTGLREGTYHSVQVRYQFEGEHWCDTLLRSGEGVRLIRVRQDFEPT